MQIKLMINEEEKTFLAHFVKGRILRRAFEINKKLKDVDELEMLDTLVEFACEVFKDQFSPDDVYDGLELEDLVPVVKGVLDEVVDKATKNIQGGESSQKKRK
jgi:hypothetical protein